MSVTCISPLLCWSKCKHGPNWLSSSKRSDGLQPICELAVDDICATPDLLQSPLCCPMTEPSPSQRREVRLGSGIGIGIGRSIGDPYGGIARLGDVGCLSLIPGCMAVSSASTLARRGFEFPGASMSLKDLRRLPWKFRDCKTKALLGAPEIAESRGLFWLPLKWEGLAIRLKGAANRDCRSFRAPLNNRPPPAGDCDGWDCTIVWPMRCPAISFAYPKSLS